LIVTKNTNYALRVANPRAADRRIVMTPQLPPNYFPSSVPLIMELSPEEEAKVGMEKTRANRCATCNKVYNSSRDLEQHHEDAHLGRRFKCLKCNQLVSGKSDFHAHVTRRCLFRSEAQAKSLAKSLALLSYEVVYLDESSDASSTRENKTRGGCNMVRQTLNGE
jgi:uncharacterized C2H2 Zn-finger protein